MNQHKILAAFSPADAVLSVRGAIQIGTSSWGVFEGDAFEIVARNPFQFPCHLRLSRNRVDVARGELSVFERRAFAVPAQLDSETSFHALFTDREVPGSEEIDADPGLVDDRLILESEWLDVYSLGGTRDEVLTDDGISAAGNLAAREVLKGYLGFLDPDDPMRIYSWHVEDGSTVERAAAAMNTTVEDAGDWMAIYKKVREKYLLGMMLEAKDRVETQLRIMRSLLGGS